MQLMVNVRDGLSGRHVGDCSSQVRVEFSMESRKVRRLDK